MDRCDLSPVTRTFSPPIVLVPRHGVGFGFNNKNYMVVEGHRNGWVIGYWTDDSGARLGEINEGWTLRDSPWLKRVDPPWGREVSKCL